MSPKTERAADELFPVEMMLSPRLKWLKKHDVIKWFSKMGEDGDGSCWYADFRNPNIKYDGPADYFFQMVESHGWDSVGEGETENDAIADLAKKRKVLLWNEE